MSEIENELDVELEQMRVQLGLTEALRTATPQQAANYIESQVTDLASAKAALKLIVRLLIIMRDRIKILK